MKHFKSWLGVALILIGIVCAIYLKINNIDMTELRLLITYWKSYIFITIVTLGGYFMISKDIKEIG